MRIYLTIIFIAQFIFANGQSFNGLVRANDPLKTAIPGAKIELIDLGKTIIADSLGKFVIYDVSPGQLHAHVSAKGFDEAHIEISLNQDLNIEITLFSSHHELDKVLVSNDGRLQRESISNVETHSFHSLNQIATPTLADALENINGVTQASTGAGISKPVIRGFSGSRVLTYVNSLRIQNQQWGADHGLAVTSLGIGSVEVIKGPASLMYGADAIGGVLYFVDEAYAPKNSLEGSIRTSFNTANLMTSNQGGIKWSKEKLKINAFVSYDNAADYRLPEGSQLLNSRYKQQAAKISIGYNFKKSVTNFRYNYYSGRIGLPGHTHDSIIDPSSFITETQNRKDNVPAQVISNHFFNLEHKIFLEKHEFLIALGNTNNKLKEHEEKFFFPEININLNNTLGHVKWKYKFHEKINLTVGSQNMLQFNVNAPLAPEVLVQDSRTIDIGTYLLLDFKKGKWRAKTGGRFDRRMIEVQEQPNLAFNGFNYAAGFSRLGKDSDVRMNLSSGFRAPTASELLSDGIHHGSNRYELGTINLKTEKSIQLDASYAVHLSDLELIVNPFVNFLRDFVYINPTDSIINNIQVFEYSQLDNAIMYGTDFGIHYHPHVAHWLHLESSMSAIFAEDQNKTPLALIPQTSINSQVRMNFKMKKGFKIKNLSLQHIYYFKQNRITSFELDSKAYHLLNVSLNGSIGEKEKLKFSLGARNLLNIEYINHLSNLKTLGITDIGINGFISLAYNFNNQNNKQ
ncbi:MAG: iron complex outermembrane receptor protein [Arenicella sp.]|jgi:iron complex outermembrane receptor protein